MKYFEAVVVSLLAVFAPIQTTLATVLALVVVDLISGVLAARKRGEPITSAQLRRSISKLFIYEVAIGMTFLSEHYLMSDEVPALKIVSGMLGMVELKSVMENLNELSGTNIFDSLISKLGSSNQKDN
jgi:phage-related holin